MDAAVVSLVLWFLLGYVGAVVVYVAGFGLATYVGAAGKNYRPVTAFVILVVAWILAVCVAALTSINVIIQIITIIQLAVNGG